MIPTPIMRQIEEYWKLMKENTEVMKIVSPYLKSVKESLLDDFPYDKQICSYCKHTSMLFDFVVEPNQDKTDWQHVIKITMRCNKLLERFSIENIYVDVKTPYAGQFVYRMYCPAFELWREEQQTEAE